MPTLMLPSISGTLCTERLKEWQPLEAVSWWILGKCVTAMSAQQEIVNLTSLYCANNVSPMSWTLTMPSVMVTRIWSSGTTLIWVTGRLLKVLFDLSSWTSGGAPGRMTTPYCRRLPWAVPINRLSP